MGLLVAGSVAALAANSEIRLSHTLAASRGSQPAFSISARPMLSASRSWSREKLKLLAIAATAPTKPKARKKLPKALRDLASRSLASVWRCRKWPTSWASTAHSWASFSTRSSRPLHTTIMPLGAMLALK